MLTKTSNQSKKQVDFYIRPFRESLTLITSKLSGSAYRIVEFMSACCTFAEEAVFMPPVKQLAEILNMGLSTVYNCLNKIEETCKFIKFQTNSQFILAYRTNSNKKFFDFQNQESFPIQKNQFQKYRKDSQNIETQSPQSLLDKDSVSLQTVQIDPNLPDRGQVSEKNTEELADKKSVETSKNKNTAYTSLPAHASKKEIPAGVTQKKYKIPEELAERLRMTEIPLTEQVTTAIASHHISQAYGAVTWVENTRETIRDPKGVFLYQLPKQPIERLGQLYPDDLLEKQKAELRRIEDERKQGISSLREHKGFAKIQKLKDRLQKKRPPAESLQGE